MKLIERGEVMGLADYETIRDRFRSRVIEEKKGRRAFLGPHASCVFENRDTVLLQIQEMLRTERITREASVLHEIETYNELIPQAHELSATILIEMPDKEPREKFLVEAKGLEREFSLVIAGAKCPGKIEAAREQELTERTTAVHYVKFDLAEPAEKALREVLAKSKKADDLVIELQSTHPKYLHSTRLSSALVQQLAEDLA